MIISHTNEFGITRVSLSESGFSFSNTVTTYTMITMLIKCLKRIINKPFSTFSWGQGSVDMNYIAARTTGLTNKVSQLVSDTMGNVATLLISAK